MTRMRRIIPYSVLFVLLFGGIAVADHGRGGRGGGRGHGGGGHDSRRVIVRDHRYRGPVRVDRKRIDRRPVRVINGRYVFSGGVSYRYTRPVIRERYYNVRVRPQVVVERYPAQPGYVWVSGSWGWDGREWVWTSGYYAPDPSITVYYDDGSWE